MPHPFGRAIIYDFFVLDTDDRESYFDMSGVTDAPSIFVYDRRPTRAEGAVGGGTGLLQTIIVWADITNGKRFTIAAIVDPDPDASIDRVPHFLAVNTPLVNGGQVQLFIRELPLQRAQAHHKLVEVLNSDLEEVFPTIDANFSTVQQDNAISFARERAIQILDSNGFIWASIWRPDRLKIALVYKSLALLMISNMSDVGDEWERRFEEYDEIYNSTLNAIKIEYDRDQDGSPESEPQVKGSFLRIAR